MLQLIILVPSQQNTATSKRLILTAVLDLLKQKRKYRPYGAFALLYSHFSKTKASSLLFDQLRSDARISKVAHHKQTRLRGKASAVWSCSRLKKSLVISVLTLASPYLPLFDQLRTSRIFLSTLHHSFKRVLHCAIAFIKNLQPFLF